VLRDGERQWVSAAELVPGDLVFVDEGARVPADGTVLQAHELSIDESLLTGESVPVSKYPAANTVRAHDAHDHQLFLGTLVLQGQGSMTVTTNGADTTLGRIGRSLSGITETRSPLQEETSKFINRFASLALALCALHAVAYRWKTGDWLTGVLA
jgi:Ca2+-transporting ATPase